MNDLIARLREEAFVRREFHPETAALLEEAAAELVRQESEFQGLWNASVKQINELRAHPALTSWDSPDALRTRIVALQQPPYSPTDSIDSVQEPLK